MSGYCSERDIAVSAGPGQAPRGVLARRKTAVGNVSGNDSREVVAQLPLVKVTGALSISPSLTRLTSKTEEH